MYSKCNSVQIIYENATRNSQLIKAMWKTVYYGQDSTPKCNSKNILCITIKRVLLICSS